MILSNYKTAASNPPTRTPATCPVGLAALVVGVEVGVLVVVVLVPVACGKLLGETV